MFRKNFRRVYFGNNLHHFYKPPVVVAEHVCDDAGVMACDDGHDGFTSEDDEGNDASESEESEDELFDNRMVDIDENEVFDEFQTAELYDEMSKINFFDSNFKKIHFPQATVNVTLLLVIVSVL